MSKKKEFQEKETPAKRGKASKGGRPKVSEDEKLKHYIPFKVNDQELKKLKKLVDESNLSQSEIIRNALFKKKITIHKKDGDLQEFSDLLNKGLSSFNKAGSNLNQAVYKLHTLDDCKEIKAFTEKLEKTVGAFIKSKEEYKKLSERIAKKWLEE